MTGPYAAEWYVRLREIEGLLGHIAEYAHDLSRERYDSDNLRRWAIQRLWIAVGEEASKYRQIADAPDATNPVWRVLAQLRHDLAHKTLADLDEAQVWRMTVIRLNGIQEQIQGLLSE